MANLTPDELTQAITIGNTDLLLTYPAGGPMLACQWSVVKALMITALGSNYLVAVNNLDDLNSVSAARTNLGLGTAALQNIGTTGANVPLLNALNQWGTTQTLVAGSTTISPLQFIAGTNLTTPISGTLEYNGTNFFGTDSSAARHTLAYLDVIAGAYAPLGSVATFTAGVQTTPVAVVFSATAMAVDCSKSNVFTTTFTANVTTAPTMTSPGDGQTINWFITQDGTGSRLITGKWPTGFKWQGGTAGVLSTAASSVDLLVATYRASTGFWYASLMNGFA
jgi:hypothetical protein